MCFGCYPGKCERASTSFMCAAGILPVFSLILPLFACCRPKRLELACSSTQRYWRVRTYLAAAALGTHAYYANNQPRSPRRALGAEEK